MVSSKTNKKKNDVIKFSKMLNDKKLSALRSGNISVRHKNGFLITPSGKKYSSLKVKDIVFVSLNGKYEKKYKPSSEWRFHQDIYVKKKDAQAIVHSHSTNATALSVHKKPIPAFHYMVALAGGNDIKSTKNLFQLFITWLLLPEVTISNVQNMQLMEQENFQRIF